MATKTYYTTEECNLAKSVTLFDYMTATCPSDIKQIHGDEYTLQSDGYIHFHQNNPMWISYDSSKGGGSTALKYLMNHRGMTYPEAVGAILDSMQLHLGDSVPSPVSFSTDNTKPFEDKTKDFVLPTKAQNYRRVFAYLSQKRCIDNELIAEMMKSGRLYEEANRHNCVFVGLDFDGNPVYGMRRGTGAERFVGDVKNSSKAYAFSLYLENSDTLVVCESPIDVLSAASMIKLLGKRIKDYCYTSLSGVYSPSQENYGKLPITLETILDHYKGIEKIILCFDGDAQGKATTDYIEKILTEKGYQVSAIRLENDMDINDVLCINTQVNSTFELGGKSN